MIRIKRLLFVLLLVVSCQKQSKGDWIKGNYDEQLEIIEKQFRGFDVAMVETGYRYQELYWAGLDGNWEYADYQLEKINLVIRNGLERRPKRSSSAQHFLEIILPEMEAVVKKQDSLEFLHAFEKLTISCNNCHAMEKVTYFTIAPPKTRVSPVQK